MDPKVILDVMEKYGLEGQREELNLFGALIGFQAIGRSDLADAAMNSAGVTPPVRAFLEIRSQIPVVIDED